MLIGYDATNAMRNTGPLGDFSRNLIALIAAAHVKDFRALLFSSHIKSDYRSFFSGDSNVSTYVPTGGAKLLPEIWLRYRLNPWLKTEKVNLFHGLNEELPFHIDRGIKTIITCYGVNEHHHTSLPDMLAWRVRMNYAFSAANIVVAVSDTVKDQILAHGVPEDKIRVIGIKGHPYEVSNELADQYFELYRSLLGY